MTDFPNFNTVKDGPMWREFTISQEQQVLSDNESVNWRHQVVTGDNMRLVIKARTRPLTIAEDREMQAFFNQIRSRGAFDLDISHGLTGKYDGTLAAAATNTTLQVNGAAAIGDVDVTLDQNLTTNSGYLPDYSFFRFANHKKIYQATNKSGTTLEFLPSLYVAVPDNTLIHAGVKKGRFRMKNGTPMSRQDFIYRTAYEFEFIEDLPRT